METQLRIKELIALMASLRTIDSAISHNLPGTMHIPDEIYKKRQAWKQAMDRGISDIIFDCQEELKRLEANYLI